MIAPLADRAAAPEVLPVPDAAGLAWAPVPAAADADLLELVRASETADATRSRTSADQVAMLFASPWFDAASDSLGGRDADGVLRAAAFVQHVPDEPDIARVVVSGTVHPDARGAGVGTGLLSWALGRARQILATMRQDLPGRISVWLEEEQVQARALHEAAGFVPVRYFHDMRRDLAQELPDVVVPAGLELVSDRVDLAEAVRLAHNEAFADHWGSQPIPRERWELWMGRVVPEWSYAILDTSGGTEEVAAYLISSKPEENWASQGWTDGHTELLGVRRAWRGRRLAPALLAAAMHAYRAAGLEFATLDVDTENPSGAHTLYGALGYERTGTSVLSVIDL
ncbi:GCN5-related protein N-acetyltransferase [Beutenbergia cavernae DSM 12333]|uniref:GCN5-related protein N-acetyltransferase n=1 Tax=Beutenbergia cavernae (strain ATCC BAA-8 / DSM 12333 / CCUG 43141 / JCM 11478 / NBRC 16432 / NCIMB 13614 / HKI 0122) TaxID=471853 RepID=C5C5I9_BEUC1|nr:GNAT family N-acetyltransferase [Beutenbergia cavernae]ACQ80180.1 GCN5-related protein N-acetyltransferase [Beutenbergia cavernae DSM 12333]